MKAFWFALCALAGLAQARPVVLEESATLTPPDASWTYFGSFGVAIDGDWALISGERYVDADGGPRHEGAAFLYRRSGNSWSYQGLLGPIAEIPTNIDAGLAMKDGVAVTIIGSARVFERSGSTWTWTSYIDMDLQGWDIEVSEGRALIPLNTCSYSDIIAHDAGGIWIAEAILNSTFANCGAMAHGDIEDGRVAILTPRSPAAVRLYRMGGPNGPGWQQFSQLDSGSVGDVFGPEVALSYPYVALTGRRERGTSIAHVAENGVASWANTGLQAVDSYLEPEVSSIIAIERAGPAMFAQRNFSFDRQAIVVNVFRVNDDEVHTSTHVAQLQARDGTSLGQWLDTCPSRIIVSGQTGPGNDNRVRIYQLPASFETPAVQVHNFDSPSSGAVWQPSAGSNFSVARVAGTGVYRQANTAGDARSWVPSRTNNQAIQAEVTIRYVTGADRWVGLMTRRSDDSNYYYVTLRTSGVVQLKRVVDGVFSTLASAPATVVNGRKYRLRLESIGNTHRVYLDDRLALTARDSALNEGDAGVAMYRASADYDNVMVTPSPLTTIYRDDFPVVFDDSLWHVQSGLWAPANGVLRQGDTTGYARTFTGTPTADQVVRARIRPTGFREPDNWVGLIARYYDYRNHLYVSLRGRGVISLWRMANGVATWLDGAPLAVTPGRWYDVRMEVVGNLTRVYVDDKLMLSTDADPGPSAQYAIDGFGHTGLVTYRAAAEFDDFRAYEP